MILAVAMLLSSLSGCSACSKRKETVGKIAETPGGVAPTYWQPETASVRAELDATYLAKYENTQTFAEVNPTGTVYYVSSVNGSNTGDGKSPAKAWKYCSKLESVTLQAGDTVLFECGSVFREQITLKSGVTYSCYGEGAKPIFYGSINASGTSKWQAVSGTPGLYQYTGTVNQQYNDIGNICFDGGTAWGIKMLKLRDSDKTLRLTNVSNGLETFSDIPSYAFSSGKDLAPYDLTYYHEASGRIYLYSASGNPGTRFRSIELGQHKMIFSASNVKNVTITNIDFRGSGTFAIRTQQCENLTVKNCSFFFIGGSIQSDYGEWRNYDTRLGNAIENWNGCDGMTVENCYFSQVYDTAMTTQSNSRVDMKNVSYRNNVIENVWFGIELWAGDDNGGCHFENVDVSGNYITGIGEGLTSQRPDKVEYGAGIEGFIKISRGPYIVANASVTDNIIDGSIGRMVQCNQPKTDQNENGFLFDRNTYVNTVGAAFLTIASTFPRYERPSTANKKYEYKVVKELVAHGFETNGTFYYSVTGEDSNEGIIQNFTIRTDTAPLYTYTAQNGIVIPFRLYLPNGYTEKSHYPLITYLNVENTSGNDNLAQVTASSLLMAKIVMSGQAVLLVPQCPEGTWTGLPVSNGNYSTGETSETAVMKAVADLIGDMEITYGTSGNFAVGADAGGYAVADLLARHQNLLRGAVILSGAGDPGAKIGNAKVWIVHSENDTLIPIADARALAEAWGAKTTFYGWGYIHDCWDDAFKSEEILNWLLGI